MSVRGYQIAFDWSRHHVWTNTKEDVSSYVTKADHVVVSYGRNDAHVTTDTDVGKMSVSLINTTRIFSPENTSSPIAGKVLPGTDGRLQVTHPTTGAITTLFLGPIDTYSANTSAADKKFSINCLDGWGTPDAESLSTAVYSGMRTGALIGVVLDAIGWDPAMRDLDAGATVVPYWWEDGTDAATAVKKLVNSEGAPAIAYVKGGVFIFRDRHHRITDTRSLTSQGTFTHIVPSGSGPAGDYKILKDSFTYDYGIANLANSVTFQVDKRVPAGLSVVWTAETPITLAALEVSTIVAQSTDPFVNAITPVQDTDYVVDSGAVTVTLSRTSGLTTLITLTAGAAGVSMSGGLALRANPLPVVTTVQVQAEDAASVGAYGRQKWQADAPWAGAGDARAIADRILSTYSGPRPTATFRFAVSPSMRSTDYSRYLTMVCGLAISDRITVRNDVLGLNSDFVVERITHDVQQLGLIHAVEVSCQVPDPTQPSNVFAFNTASHGFNDGLFAVTGIDSASNVFLFDTAAGHGFDQGLFAN